MNIYDNGGKIGIGLSNPSAQLDLNMPAGVYEKLFLTKVSDANDDHFRKENATGVSGQFIPYLIGRHASDNRTALFLRGEIDTTNDSGTSPVVSFDAGATSSAITTRPLFMWSNNFESKMVMTAGGFNAWSDLSTYRLQAGRFRQNNFRRGTGAAFYQLA